MTDPELNPADTEQLVHHLETALDATEMEETNFHLRHALQLLTAHE